MKLSARKALTKAQMQLLLHRRWAYLRYLHLREGVVEANRDQSIETVLAVGCGRGVAETALAIEFPHLHFHLTDVASDRTPNYQMAQRMVTEWEIPNVTFGVMDIFEPAERRYDLVTTIEVLEHLEDDDTAAKALEGLANRAVFTLVPFADASANADENRRRRVWENNEHFRVGYDEARLRELFHGVATVRGTYWADAGLGLRRYLQDASVDEIRARTAELVRQAREDVRSAIPTRISQAAGIWSLSYP
jgi:cyclopropane fatty-acyl-phospholipid synthase-like methyltransferase